MRTSVTLLILIFFFSFYQKDDGKKTLRIVMLGDSITEYADRFSSWPELFGVDSVFNFGSAFAETNTLLTYPKDVPLISQAINKRPTVIYLMIGINDAHHKIPLDTTLKNFNSICDSIDKYEIELIVQSVLPTTGYYDTLHGEFTSNGILANRSQIMNSELKALCKKRNYQFLDLRPYLTDGRFLKNEYSTDGIHLNLAGYKQWMKAIIMNYEL